MKKFLIMNVNVLQGLAPAFMAIYGLALYVSSLELALEIDSVFPILLAMLITIIALHDINLLKLTKLTKKILSNFYGVSMSNINYDSFNNKGAIIHLSNQKDIYLQKKLVGDLFHKALIKAYK